MRLIPETIFGYKPRILFAWLLFWGSLVGWPYSIWATDEPVFILSLSWLAITLTAWDIIQTTCVRDGEE